MGVGLSVAFLPGVALAPPFLGCPARALPLAALREAALGGVFTSTSIPSGSARTLRLGPARAFSFGALRGVARLVGAMSMSVSFGWARSLPLRDLRVLSAASWSVSPGLPRTLVLAAFRGVASSSRSSSSSPSSASLSTCRVRDKELVARRLWGR